MLGVAIGLAAIIGGLALMTYVKTRYAVSAISGVVRSMEQSTRKVAVLAGLPGTATTLWLVKRGIAPPPALVVGFLAGFGVFAIALAILKMEGILTERESELAARVAAGGPPPSTPAGRIVWSAVGVVAIAMSLAALHVVSS